MNKELTIIKNKRGVSITIMILVVATIVLAIMSWQASITKNSYAQTRIGQTSYLDLVHEQKTIIQDGIKTPIYHGITRTKENASQGITEYEEIIKENIMKELNKVRIQEIREINSEQIKVEIIGGEAVITITNITITRDFREGNNGIIVEYTYNETITMPLEP